MGSSTGRRLSLHSYKAPVTNLTAIRRAREMIAFVEDRESSVTAPYDAIAAEAHSANRNCNMGLPAAFMGLVNDIGVIQSAYQVRGFPIKLSGALKSGFQT